MIINQAPPSGGGGGGSTGEWVDISSAAGSDDTDIQRYVCETDGQYVHVAGVVYDDNSQDMYIAGYPPNGNDLQFDMYDYSNYRFTKAGTIHVFDDLNNAHGHVAYIYPYTTGFFSIVYPIAN